ncbi:hypothetical protein AHAS_Ahas08G0128400 [Arachis hypogaea]
MMFLNPLAKAMLKPLMIAHNSVCMIEQLPKLHEKPLMNLSKLSRSTPPHATLFELIMKDLSTLTLMKFSYIDTAAGLVFSPSKINLFLKNQREERATPNNTDQSWGLERLFIIQSLLFDLKKFLTSRIGCKFLQTATANGQEIDNADDYGRGKGKERQIMRTTSYVACRQSNLAIGL